MQNTVFVFLWVKKKKSQLSSMSLNGQQRQSINMKQFHIDFTDQNSEKNLSEFAKTVMQKLDTFQFFIKETTRRSSYIS